MKIIIIGNAGAGKSTLAKHILSKEKVALLSLDEVAFTAGADRRPIEDILLDAMQFVSEHDSWIIEGCYADIIRKVLDYCDELVFLNPGVDSCVQNCLARPWEPNKFTSLEEQNKNLDNLIEWVRQYDTRTDEYGLASHRDLYESFKGRKFELTELSQYRKWASDFLA